MAKGQLPEIVGGELLRLIEARKATLGGQVEGILRDRESASADRGNIIHHLGECVGAADRNAALQAFAQADRPGVGARITLRSLPEEGLRCRNADAGQKTVGGNFVVETCALRPGIVEVQEQRWPDLLLNVEEANLHVAEAVVGIDGVAVGNQAAGWSGETVLQSECAHRGLHVGFGVGEGRLEGEFLGNGLKGAGVVVDAVAGANHHFVPGLPSDADARGKVVAVGMDQGWGIALAGQHWHQRGSAELGIENAGRKNQVGDAIIELGKRRNVLPAHAQIEGEIASQFPFILGVGVPGISAEVVGIGGERIQRGLQRSLLRQAE